MDDRGAHHVLHDAHLAEKTSRYFLEIFGKGGIGSWIN